MIPRDKHFADSRIRILEATGDTADPQNIGSRAARNGWRIRSAEELDAQVPKILVLKRTNRTFETLSRFERKHRRDRREIAETAHVQWKVPGEIHPTIIENFHLTVSQ